MCVCGLLVQIRAVGLWPRSDSTEFPRMEHPHQRVHDMLDTKWCSHYKQRMWKFFFQQSAGACILMLKACIYERNLYDAMWTYFPLFVLFVIYFDLKEFPYDG